VSQFPLDKLYLDAVNSAHSSENRLKVLLVCRVASEKVRTLRIVYRYIKQNLDTVSFVHVGIVQDAGLAEELYGNSIDNYVHLRDSMFTDNASKALYWCDAFSGIGRSVIEAMACGKPAFVPVLSPSGDGILVAVTIENWKIFARHNFTDRVPYAELANAGEIISLLDLQQDRDLGDKLSKEVNAIYTNNYRPELFVEQIKKFLDETNSTRISIIGRVRIRILYFLQRFWIAVRTK
jgi:glycosyltransferase involved in cell wall biosynthesis